MGRIQVKRQRGISTERLERTIQTRRRKRDKNNCGRRRGTADRTPESGAGEELLGQKKRHTTKYQIVINQKTKEILDVYNDVGTAHDFRMFKERLVGVLPENILMLLDSGFQGAGDYFPNALLPYKASKNNPLTDEQKAWNTMIAKLRVVVEHIIRQLKIFRICKETYRGKGDSGLRRVKIVASIVNHMALA